MGNFVGHFVPGIFFIIFSLWWTINLFKFYFESMRKNKIINLNVAIKENKINFSNFHNKPLEGLILIFFLPIAIIGEYITGFENGPNICIDNIQHIVMYTFFLLVALTNLLEFYSIILIPSISDLMYAIAFGVETLLLYFHFHNQGLLEQHLHKLLTFNACLCCLSSILVAINKHSFIANLFKSLFTLLQGTFFIQIAFQLYPLLSLHRVKNSNHQALNNTLNHVQSVSHHIYQDIMLTTAYFCLNFAGCLILFFCLIFICKRKYLSKDLGTKYKPLLTEEL